MIGMTVRGGSRRPLFDDEEVVAYTTINGKRVDWHELYRYGDKPFEWEGFIARAQNAFARFQQSTTETT